MKRNSTLNVLLMLVGLTFYTGSFAQTINTSTTWSALKGSNDCWGCTITIAPGATLTMDAQQTCGNCSFSGGNIVFTQPFVIQSSSFTNDSITIKNVQVNLKSNLITFTGTSLSVTGNGSLLANAPVTLTNSVFRFYNKSWYLNNNSAYTSNNSRVYLSDTAYFKANSGPVNLNTNSEIVAGDGTLKSAAYIYMAMGGGLNIDNSSSIKIANYNNYYFNWSGYTSNGNNYTTTNNSIHCSGAYPNACSAPNVYGCATLTKSGMLACTSLPLVDINFAARADNSGNVQLTWTAGQELNADHFTVQRSNNGQDWTDIGSVASRGYAGTSSDYSYIDPAPQDGTSYYRLLIDYRSGQSDYTKTIPVSIRTSGNTVSIYPNPVTNQSFHLNTSTPDNHTVSVYNMGGQLLWRTSLTGQTQYLVAMPGSVPHNQMIIIQVIGQEKTQSFKVFNQ